jgi:hypothetical protein
MYAHGLGFEVNDGFDGHGHGHGHGHGDFSGCMLGNTKHQTPNIIITWNLLNKAVRKLAKGSHYRIF